MILAALLMMGCNAAHSTTWYVSDPELVDPAQNAIEAWAPATAYQYNVQVGSGGYHDNVIRITDGGEMPGFPDAALCVKDASVARSAKRDCIGHILVCRNMLDQPDRLQKTLSHEFGHFLGAEHPDGGVMHRGWGSEPFPTPQNIQAVIDRAAQPCE